jgi:hypothetical protein
LIRIWSATIFDLEEIMYSDINVKKSAGYWLFSSVLILTLLAILMGLALPAKGAQQTKLEGPLSNHLSQSVSIRAWLANPDQAPMSLRHRFQQFNAFAKSFQGQGSPVSQGQGRAGLFNRDEFGLPQNEESITLCGTRPEVVLGGTNDYRGILDPAGNFTGWHLSLDGGKSVTNEGLLPPVEVAGNPTPSGGDPVVADGSDCSLFAASLNYDPFDPFGNPNGIGVYRSDPETLDGCPGGSDPSCWPVRRAVAESAPPHFLDKECFDVGVSGEAGEVVWVTYTDFINDPSAPLGFTSASIQAVRCTADLSSCTEPILISGDDLDVQFSDVTIGPDGRVYVTWAEIQGELEFEPQTFIIKLRIAPAGSTEFGPTQIIHEEDLAIPFGGILHANDFRVATYPKHEVVLIDGGPRIFAIWDACSERVLDFICEESVIKLKYSDDDGATWSDVIVLSRGGDNYFPAITTDGNGRVVAAWFTNRYDRIFHNRQDVDFIVFNAKSLKTRAYRRLTRPSNESEADPLVGGSFIGDYIEVAARSGKAYVHYNANYRQIELLGLGVPIPQQDNFLTIVRFGGGDDD